MSTPVVLVPGLGLDRRVFGTVLRLLDGPVSVRPLPSMGLGAPRGTDLTVQAQAARVVGLLPPRRPVVLVGYSASCAVVVEVARQVPVAGLVLVGPVTDPRGASWPRIAARWVRSARHEGVREGPVLVPQHARTGASAILRGMDVLRRYRTDEAVVGLDVPVEVVGGELDRIAPRDWCETLALGADDRVTTVPGAAHMLPLTHPDEVVAAVRRVLARSAELTAPGSAPPR